MSAKSELNFFFVMDEVYAISGYIRPRYIGSWLYFLNFLLVIRVRVPFSYSPDVSGWMNNDIPLRNDKYNHMGTKQIKIMRKYYVILSIDLIVNSNQAIRSPVEIVC